LGPTKGSTIFWGLCIDRTLQETFKAYQDFGHEGDASKVIALKDAGWLHVAKPLPRLPLVF